MYGGPSPRIRALASQDKLTRRNWLASFGVTNRSKPVSVFAALLSLIGRQLLHHDFAGGELSTAALDVTLLPDLPGGYAQFRGVAVRASVTTLQEREVHRSKLTRTYRAVNHRAARAELRIDSSGGSTGSACSIFRGIGPRPGLQAPARHVWTSKTQLEMGKNRLGGLARNFSAGGVRADPNERR
jgi:hypothetical protein